MSVFLYIFLKMLIFLYGQIVFASIVTKFIMFLYVYVIWGIRNTRYFGISCHVHFLLFSWTSTCHYFYGSILHPTTCMYQKSADILLICLYDLHIKLISDNILYRSCESCLNDAVFETLSEIYVCLTDSLTYTMCMLVCISWLVSFPVHRDLVMSH